MTCGNLQGKPGIRVIFYFYPRRRNIASARGPPGNDDRGAMCVARRSACARDFIALRFATPGPFDSFATSSTTLRVSAFGLKLKKGSLLRKQGTNSLCLVPGFASRVRVKAQTCQAIAGYGIPCGEPTHESAEASEKQKEGRCPSSFRRTVLFRH